MKAGFAGFHYRIHFCVLALFQPLVACNGSLAEQFKSDSFFLEGLLFARYSSMAASVLSW